MLVEYTTIVDKLQQLQFNVYQGKNREDVYIVSYLNRYYFTVYVFSFAILIYLTPNLILELVTIADLVINKSLVIV